MKYILLITMALMMTGCRSMEEIEYRQQLRQERIKAREVRREENHQRKLELLRAKYGHSGNKIIINNNEE